MGVDQAGRHEGTGELDHLVDTVAVGVGEHTVSGADAGDPAVGDADRRAVERRTARPVDDGDAGEDEISRLLHRFTSVVDGGGVVVAVT